LRATGARRTLTRTRAAIAFAVATGLIGPLTQASPALAGAPDLLPDMRMAPIYSLQLTTTANGRDKLRFGTIAFNVGDGPLEVRARDRDRRDMNRIVQRVYRSDETSYSLLKPDARVFYSGDGHDHWHVQRFISVRLLPTGATPATERRIRKIGFCLVDSAPIPESQRPPNAVDHPVYVSCGTRQSQSIRVGVSVGWGDNYPPEFAHQAVDVTGLPQGTYRLCATVNPKGIWTEKNSNFSNNSYWRDIRLDVATGELEVIGSGQTPC
jgi:hypothetical protein